MKILGQDGRIHAEAPGDIRKGREQTALVEITGKQEELYRPTPALVGERAHLWIIQDLME